MSLISEEARRASVELAESRGVFPNFEGSVYAADGLSVRNETVTTIAPTGSLSIIAGCSSGIEPLFSVRFIRKVLDTELVEVNPLFEKTARERGFYSEELKRSRYISDRKHSRRCSLIAPRFRRSSSIGIDTAIP